MHVVATLGLLALDHVGLEQRELIRQHLVGLHLFFQPHALDQELVLEHLVLLLHNAHLLEYSVPLLVVVFGLYGLEFSLHAHALELGLERLGVLTLDESAAGAVAVEVVDVLLDVLDEVGGATLVVAVGVFGLESHHVGGLFALEGLDGFLLVDEMVLESVGGVVLLVPL